MSEQLRYPCLYAFTIQHTLKNKQGKQTRKEKTKKVCNYEPNSVRANDFTAGRGNPKERHTGFCWVGRRIRF